MNEYIKAIKVVHQLLILAASAVLAFALTPDVEGRYAKADKTLVFLQGLDRKSWDTYVKSLVPGWSEYSGTVRQFIHGVDPSATSEVQLTPYVFSDLTFPVQGPLLDVRHYVEGRQRLRTVSMHLSVEDLRRRWNEKLRQRGPANAVQTGNAIGPVHVRITAVNLIPPQGGWGGGAYDAVRIVQVDGSLDFDQTAKLTITFDPTTGPPGLLGNTVTLAIPTSFSSSREEPFALRWLEAQDSNGVLQKEDGKPTRVLSYLDPFMSEIGGLDLNGARLKLQSDKDAQHGKLALFGLSVDADSTVDIMPWVTSGILVFFLAHIRQFRRSVSQLGQESPPWVGLFDDWAGVTVSLVTILLMPFIANLLLIERHGIHESRSAAFAALMTVGLLSIWSWLELVALRSKLRH